MIDENIEFILQGINQNFDDKEYAFMLLEMLIFALESNKGMSLVEAKI